MTTTLTYLDAVRAELRDLPELERDELLEDVASSGDDDHQLETRLGPPAQFARELRSAAGLQATGAPTPAEPSARDRVSALVARAIPVARELAPLGWLVRGYVAAVAIGFTINGAWHGNRPGVFTISGNVWNAFFLCLMCIAASVLVGAAMRLSTRRSPAMVVVNVVLALGAIPIAVKVIDQIGGDSNSAFTNTQTYAQPEGLAFNGVPVTNIYPYSREGKPLYDVRLYDENGQALEVGRAVTDPSRRVPRTQLGTMAFNAFPIRYFDPDSTRVSKPREGFKRRAPLVRPRALGQAARTPKRAR
jgi:hypothetical protein